MEWPNNAKLSFLQKKRWKDLEELKNSSESSVFITITDQTMYDSFEENDTVRIKLSNQIPDEADCLIYNDSMDSFLFKHVKKEDDYYIVSQTFPEKTQKEEDLEILGYATSILRT